ncbi:hypothetical protein PMAYCL1PPCAC_32126 [Pristionchus mayeri]|uniref:TIL domain-containing protein n=1 Tax=Pristionchus mayeri TaxID=1317129 RepID=A0AAN5DF97_9BILA|nr:hypothetical protein PMAYCL1PPCAC_32126 [Pristionchus mayeri]
MKLAPAFGSGRSAHAGTRAANVRARILSGSQCCRNGKCLIFTDCVPLCEATCGKYDVEVRFHRNSRHIEKCKIHLIPSMIWICFKYSNPHFGPGSCKGKCRANPGCVCADGFFLDYKFDCVTREECETVSIAIF